jgi:hypothetical protein
MTRVLGPGRLHDHESRSAAGMRGRLRARLAATLGEQGICRTPSRRVRVLRVLPVLVAIVLVVFCLIDLAQTPVEDVRALPKPIWALILLVPFVGPVLWLAFGRPAASGVLTPRGTERNHPAGAVRPVAPDDNPEFLARLKQHRLNAEDERLRRWQADLERREQELRRRDDDSGSGHA